MLKNIFLLLFIPFIGLAQNDMEKFHALFKEIEMDVIHYYAQYNHSKEFEATSTYPFIGTKIDSSFLHLLKGKIESIDTELKYSDFHAVHRFFITSKKEGFIVREYHDGTRMYQLHYLTYDHDENDFSDHLTLAFNYGEEGSFGNKESWFIDINKDGKKDIITHKHNEYYLGSDAEYFEHDTFLLFIWEDKNLREIGIEDEELHEQLSNDFPFHNQPSISYQTERNLSQYLKKKANLHILEYSRENWAIMAGSDKNLNAAKFEIDRAVKIIAYDYKYQLDARLFNIYQKNERYYTVISRFKTRNEAEIALLEIKKKFNATAYVFDMDKWCKEHEYMKGQYYQCSE